MHKLSKEENIHIDLMKQIVDSFYSLPIVLKGGTSLLLNYGLDRFSEDLDFDSNKKLNLISKLTNILDINTESYTYKILKDTDTVQRIRVNYIKDKL
jgi:predicted nucleotidyltransferase component of viral defense system